MNLENNRRNKNDSIMVYGNETFRERIGLFWIAYADHMCNKYPLWFDYEIWKSCYIRANIYLGK